MTQYLSKSRLMSFRQCPLRLWNEVHRRDEMTKPDDSTQHRFDMGMKVGELAQQRWPGGCLIDAQYFETEKALAQTLDALRDELIPAVYEAAFVANNTQIRADILVRLGNGKWAIWEVKAVSGPKQIHEIDFAIQIAVIRQWAANNGFPLDIVEGGILHLNNQYVYGGGDYDLANLFTESDMMDKLDGYSEEVARLMQDGYATMQLQDAPMIHPGAHCADPYECPFIGTACVEQPKDELAVIPGFGEVKVRNLHERGVVSLDDLVSQHVQLNDVQYRALESHLDGQRRVDAEGIQKELASIGFPRYHLDFETTGPMAILPIWEGTRPFQPIPFQFSYHLERSPAETVVHDEYLHDGVDDPRRPLALALIEHLNKVPGPILMYSPYERTVIRALAGDLPDLAGELEKLEQRLVDLQPILKKHVYDPAFDGSFSIKVVLPGLLEDEGYKGLGIQDGETASLQYLRRVELLRSEMTEADQMEAQQIRTDLWLYCEKDTEAMVKLLGWLERQAGMESN